MVRLATRKRSTGYVVQDRNCWCSPFPYAFVWKTHTRKGTLMFDWLILHIRSRRNRRMADFNWLPY